MTGLQDSWVYLSSTPLFHLTLTLIAFQAGDVLSRRFNGTPLLNPVLIGVLIVVAVLLLTGTSYATYFEGAQFVHFLLGPATVALAVPLYRQFALVRRSALALAAALLAGSASAVVAAVGLGHVLGANEALLASLAPKSVTAPVAMGIAEQIGGVPSLTAVLVLATGITGAMFGPLLLDLLKIRAPEARGLALGTASHGIGTARALQDSEAAGAFSGLAMGLNALATALLLPIFWAIAF
ncbi:Inner membrane protein YohK [Pseudoruegeria aquimaris]|uniref:Inner membrane protein YohK n=1 Tax=Pseudoruegeria aquimaris TaxID=393663 RepID=A0A1Y5STR2_9RHOB|nr:LrgB family protein [Pseudoruegeria aquimaris]SLN48332.1 Inner membrane protein YohK [Pseudoruegeria aquimaris]